jgi:hypothetical protein
MRREWAAISRSAGVEPRELVPEVLGQQRAPQHSLDAAVVTERALVALADKQSTWRPAELLRELAANLDGDLAMAASELVDQLEALTDSITREMLVDLSPPIVEGAVLRRDGRPITEPAIGRRSRRGRSSPKNTASPNGPNNASPIRPPQITQPLHVPRDGWIMRRRTSRLRLRGMPTWCWRSALPAPARPPL